MFYCYEPTMTFAPCFPCGPRYSRCATSPSFFFLLPLLVFGVPMISFLVALVFKLIFLFAPFLLFFSLMSSVCNSSGCAKPAAKEASGTRCGGGKEKTAAGATAPTTDSTYSFQTVAGATASATDSTYSFQTVAGATASATDSTYSFHVPAPGVRSHDVKCTLDHNNVIAVKGESPTSGGTALATVNTAVRLPPDANEQTLTVSVAEGLVTITVEKKKPRVLRVAPHHPPASPRAPEQSSSAAVAPPASAPVARSIPIDEPPAAPFKAAESQSEGEDEDEAGFVAVSQSSEGKKDK